MIDADEDAHGGTGVGVKQRNEFGGAAIECLGVALERAEEGDLVGCGLAAGGEGKDALGRDGVFAEHVGGEIDAAAIGIFLDVAQDVGELEGDAGVDGKLVGAAVGVAEDADADEANDGGYEIAVVIKGGDAFVDLNGTGGAGGSGNLEGADTFGLGLEVEGGAGDELLEEIVGDGEAALRIVEGEEDWIGGGSGARGTPGGSPGSHGMAARVERKGLVVGEVVGFAHEGVDGAHGVGLVLREDAERVVEILGLALGDGATRGVGRNDLWGLHNGLGDAHADASGVGLDEREGLSDAVNLPRSAPPRRRSLADLVTTGRDLRVS